MANNTRLNTSTTTNSRPNNSPLLSSGAKSIPKDHRDLLHPKVRIFFSSKLIFIFLYFSRN